MANTNYTTRGGQIVFHNLRMFFQIQGWVVKLAMFLAFVLTLLYTWLATSTDTLLNAFFYLKFQVLMFFHPADSATSTMIYHGTTYKNTIVNFANNTMLYNDWTHFAMIAQLAFVAAFFSVCLVGWTIMHFFNRQGQKQSEDKHIRGFQLAEPKVITKTLIKRAKVNKKRGYGNGSISSFKIDGHALSKQHFEVQHLLIDGTTGAGKSVMIRKLLRWIRGRGDKAIVYDKGCTFVSKFYNADTDVILNPFDDRCAHWDIWCDAKDAPDFENMAAALIPQHGDGDPFWVDSARTIFSSSAYRMSQDDQPKTTARLLSLILTSELEALGSFLKGTEATSLVSGDIKKTAISIKSVLATYIKSLRFLDGLDSPNRPDALKQRFSITDWVQDDKQRGCLFLSSNAQQHASLRPLISMWLAIASNAILGLVPNEDRRIWVIMDEMPSLHKLPELGSIIAEVRKFGGCYLIGIQSYAQLVKTYGKNAADEMFDLLNTRFFFRAPSEPMARISSKDLGEQEVDISKENISYGANTLRDGVSLGHQTITRPVVSASEIQALDDLQCYLRTPGVSLITKLDLHFDKMRDICAPFNKRDIVFSAAMNTAYEQAIYHECVAPTQHLSTEERQALIKVQESQFENDEQMHAETKPMKNALKSDTVTQMREENKAHQHAHEQDQEAQRNIDEAAISQDLDMSEIGD
ncbi:type IV conjugative transfer system coupling protein TraD [Vibrio mediterranei]|uniref:type IV conjugative transfer system coupling protein TraD n=1 Tax=Vibrio mediterranei TaxID=689 RepID=UPI002284DEE6|nr:type IV conjugative transfer system coupling protein TraD [Vibrio mediterranei]MCY9855407.1 type IV conjugative transfer system coupling protein TraD [Vibrio mediterranei]